MLPDMVISEFVSEADTKIMLKSRCAHLWQEMLAYERVQPVSLISLSSNWIILHNIKRPKLGPNPTGTMLYGKNFSKNMVCPKWKSFVEEKKRRF